MVVTRLIICALALACAIPSQAADRSRAVRAEFQRSNPCPSTGATRGACPGYQADHKTPLCIGGKDAPSNLQWISIEAHKAKTKSDVRLCRTHP
jgi:hypothetical protein